MDPALWYVIRTSADGNCMYVTLSLAEHARTALEIAGAAVTPDAARAALAARFPPLKARDPPFRLMTSDKRVLRRARAIRAEVAHFFSPANLASPLAFDLNAWITAVDEATGAVTTVRDMVLKTYGDEDPACEVDPDGCVAEYVENVGKHGTWGGTPEMYAYAVRHGTAVLSNHAHADGMTHLEDGVVPPGDGVPVIRMLYQVWGLSGGAYTNADGIIVLSSSDEEGEPRKPEHKPEPEHKPKSEPEPEPEPRTEDDIEVMFDTALDKALALNAALLAKKKEKKTRGVTVKDDMSAREMNSARAKHFSLLLNAAEVALLLAVYGGGFMPTVRPLLEYLAAVGLAEGSKDKDKDKDKPKPKPKPRAKVRTKVRTKAKPKIQVNSSKPE